MHTQIHTQKSKKIILYFKLFVSKFQTDTLTTQTQTQAFFWVDTSDYT